MMTTTSTSKLRYCEILSCYQTIRILLPDIPLEQVIAERIENEQKLVDADLLLRAIYEQKINDRIEKLWNVKSGEV